MEKILHLTRGSRLHVLQLSASFLVPRGRKPTIGDVILVGDGSVITVLYQIAASMHSFLIKSLSNAERKNEAVINFAQRKRTDQDRKPFQKARLDT
jgi:hypothetical protein